jgi:hypothetical protein
VHQSTHSLARFFLEVDANYKQFKAASQLRAAANELLATRKSDYEAGRTPIERYLEAVEQWLNASAQEAQYKCTYNTAIAAFEEVKGTLLAHDNIVVDLQCVRRATPATSSAPTSPSSRHLVVQLSPIAPTQIDTVVAPPSSLPMPVTPDRTLPMPVLPDALPRIRAGAVAASPLPPADAEAVLPPSPARIGPPGPIGPLPPLPDDQATRTSMSTSNTIIRPLPSAQAVHITSRVLVDPYMKKTACDIDAGTKDEACGTEVGQSASRWTPVKTGTFRIPLGGNMAIEIKATVQPKPTQP